MLVCKCLPLIGSDCVFIFILVPTLDTDEDEITSAGLYRRRSGSYDVDQDQGQTRTKASHPDACCYYLSLSIMHVFTFEVLQKDLFPKQKLFLLWLYYYSYILAITLPIVKTW